MLLLDSTISSLPNGGQNGKENLVKTRLLRWYIVIIFSLFTFTQGGVWNTWGPISDSAQYAFCWENSDIALLANWGPIAYLISACFFAWVLDVKGILNHSVV